MSNSVKGYNLLIYHTFYVSSTVSNKQHDFLRFLPWAYLNTITPACPPLGGVVWCEYWGGFSA